jgi:hypothetical protein
MDDENFKDLALKARELYSITQSLQKILLAVFFEEFCRLDEEEEKEKLLRYVESPPS